MFDDEIRRTWARTHLCTSPNISPDESERSTCGTMILGGRFQVEVGRIGLVGMTTILSNGIEMPSIGLGLWEVPAETTQHTVEMGVELGYRHFDGAAAYRNEEGFGAGIRSCGVAREELFVTTKLQNGNQGYTKALKAFDTSLDSASTTWTSISFIGPYRHGACTWRRGKLSRKSTNLGGQRPLASRTSHRESLRS